MPIRPANPGAALGKTTRPSAQRLRANRAKLGREQLIRKLCDELRAASDVRRRRMHYQALRMHIDPSGWVDRQHIAGGVEEHWNEKWR